MSTEKMPTEKMTVRKTVPSLLHPSRRDAARLMLGASLLGTGLIAAMPRAFAAEGGNVTPPFPLVPPFPTDDDTVKIKTPDGTAEAAIIRPERGAFPCVVMWPDAMGLRPETRSLATRIAAEGYQVLMPNPFYRVADAETALKLKGKDREKLYASLTASGVVELDASVFIAYVLNMIPDTKGGMVATIGYGLGGAYALRTAAAEPRRVRALVAMHAGNTLPVDAIRYLRANTFIGIAAEDDQKAPAYKETLRKAFTAARNPADVEVYAGTKQGFAVPGATYSAPQAEKATLKTVAFLREHIIVGTANPSF